MEVFDDERFWEWIAAHEGDDPVKLRLAWHGREPWIDDAVRQIECRRKYRRKLPCEVACGRFYFPTALSGEQSTSDELASMHATMIPDGVRSVVDLTAGLGVDAMTIAREKGMRVTAIERNPDVAAALRHNSCVMGVEVDAMCADCRDYMAAVPDGAFDLVFIDPARRDTNGGRVFGLADCQPDVVAMFPLLCRKARMLIVKMSPMLDVTQTLRELPGTTDLWALGTSTECKELVARCDLSVSDAAASDMEPCIHAATPHGDFSFTRREETEAEPVYGVPEAGGWLYEPWPAVMKVAPWRLLSERFGTVQLHPNTHLYYSAEPVPDFPGEGRRIIEIMPFASSVLKQLPRRYPRMQVATRNFPMTTDVLSRKLRAKEGAMAPRLMGATVVSDAHLLIMLEAK